MFRGQFRWPIEFDPRAVDDIRGRGDPQRCSDAVVEVSPVETVLRYLVRLWSYGHIMGLKVDRKLDFRDGIRFACYCRHGTECEQGTP